MRPEAVIQSYMSRNQQRLVCCTPDGNFTRRDMARYCGFQFSIYSRYVIEKYIKKVQEDKDQEMAQSEKDSHSKNRGGKKLN